MGGLLRRLHKFFYSDDEIVKLADGLNEFDAGSYEELLRNSGIVAMRKNMETVYDRYWRPMLFDDFALYVKQSDCRSRDRGPFDRVAPRPARGRRRQ